MQILARFLKILAKIPHKIYVTTGNFIPILGLFLLLTGIWIFLRPERARKSFAKARGFGLLKWYLLMPVLYLALLVFPFTNRFSGILPLVIQTIAILFLVKVYFILVKKTHGLLAVRMNMVSTGALVIFDIIQMAIGMLFLFSHNRLWDSTV